MYKSFQADFNDSVAASISFSAYQQNRGITNDELRWWLREAVLNEVEKGLTGRQYELLTLYYFRGYTMPQLAERFGINKSTVSRGLAGARNRIKKRVLRRLKAEKNGLPLL
ncbi:sigma factor-like helix-turn-helix DNA-binding protein [Acetanaerobacterium elongatum]|uniref:RNA polymerase sigma factor, sigma-70 family n=1 Tax=Acetanaerobacterium elongatum TaxID=258515 RepID=A0A1G9V9Z7_9FIRM|nr:sigma factor-like helix-turn-helix DNA-binding protein [Acetanaerobacterium elongatum]SDM69022.1 RNA polymerase sigma factor, sigma-70 family [Acetanaerobacterium elongatum]